MLAGRRELISLVHTIVQDRCASVIIGLFLTNTKAKLTRVVIGSRGVQRASIWRRECSVTIFDEMKQNITARVECRSSTSQSLVKMTNFAEISRIGEQEILNFMDQWCSTFLEIWLILLFFFSFLQKLRIEALWTVSHFFDNLYCGDICGKSNFYKELYSESDRW